MARLELSARNSAQTDFGAYLRQAREDRGLSVADVAATTRIQPHMLERLEEGSLEGLPAQVFVRGFVRAHARTVGADAKEAIRRFDAFLEARDLASRPPVELIGDQATGPAHGRRRVGVALVVLLLLIVATITVSSLLVHRSAATTGDLSDARTAPARTLA